MKTVGSQRKSPANKKNGKPTQAGLPAKDFLRTEKTPVYTICIGASAGGLNAVGELISQLPASLNAAIFVVLHLSKAAIGSILAERIKRETVMPCDIARDAVTIRPGHIYIAPPDSHLLIKKNKIVIGHGPPENRFRPSIDVLFRSAAVNNGPATVGIVLTGFLNDGTSGMRAIKSCGGHCIVQDPNEAEYPDMPLSVLEAMEVDHCISLKDMGKVLVGITAKAPSKTVVPPLEIAAESELSEKAATDLRKVAQIGTHTIYSCPSCGGGLWQIGDKKAKHYRCHIGHSFSEKELAINQSETIEHTLWVAVRMMEERKQMLLKMARENNDKGLGQLSDSFQERSDQLDGHIKKLKQLLFSINRD